jgi:hypothetical protein
MKILADIQAALLPRMDYENNPAERILPLRAAEATRSDR